MSRSVEFNELVGKVLKEIVVSQQEDLIKFETEDGEVYMMYHHQDCCEGVYVEDICGELDDLIGTPILVAEESTNDEPPPDSNREYHDELELWTFYKLDTIKGGVTIRWYGSSNGYYGVAVDFEKVD